MAPRPASSCRENDPGFRAVGDRDAEAGVETTGAREDRDLAALQEAREPLEETIDDLVLAGLTDREVHHDALGVDTEVRGVLDGPSYVSGLEELLGGDAAAMQAGSTDLVTLDEGHG